MPQQLKDTFEFSGALLRVEGRFLQIASIRVQYNTRFTTGNCVRKLTLADGRAIVQDGAIVSGHLTCRW